MEIYAVVKLTLKMWASFNEKLGKGYHFGSEE